MDIKTMSYKSLEWYVIKETSTELLLFLKDSLSKEIVRQVFNKYFYEYCVEFNQYDRKIWWEDSYIREKLNDVFLKEFLDVNDLNIMKTTLELDGKKRTTEDYVRLITKEEVESLPLEILKTKRTNGYWTMSPNHFDSSYAIVFVVKGSDDPGQLASDWVHFAHSARPMVSVKSDILISNSQNSGLIIKSSEEDRKKIIRKKLERLRNL